MRPDGSKKKWILSCAAVATAVAVTSGAAAQEPSEARVRELVRLAADRLGSGQAGVSGTTPATQATPPAQGDTRPVVRITLDEAVKFALERNLDISVQRLNPEINDIALASLQSVYNPALTSVVGNQSLVQLPTTQLVGGTNVLQKTLTYNGGVAQNLPWGGGAVSANLNNFRRESSSVNVLFNPAFNAIWSAAYTQPLLRGFHIDSTRQQIQVTKVNRDISDVQLRATITNTLSNVRNAYWDYVFATQAVEVARQSLNLASKLVQDNQTRVQVGTMAPIDVVQAQSEQATRRQNLVTAESTRRTTELALKRFIVAGTQDPNWNATLDPIDRPDFRPEPIDIEAAVRRALSERTDLAIAKKNIESNNVTLRFLQDQTLPQTDVLATYGVQGIGGTQFVRSSSGVLGGAPTTVIPGGIGDAFHTLFANNYPTWNVQVNISYPLGTSTQKAAVARARVQMNQVQAQLKQIELQVATDVTNASLTAQSTAEAVQAAQAARELSLRKLEAEQSKFEVGMSTNYFVVQAQRDLADVQNSELRAVLNYRKALVELDRLQQTTLQNSNITVLGTGGLNNSAVGSGRPTVVAGG